VERRGEKKWNEEVKKVERRGEKKWNKEVEGSGTNRWKEVERRGAKKWGKVDMKRLGLVNDDTHNRDMWRSLVTGCRPTLPQCG